jgi:hypothetical protein
LVFLPPAAAAYCCLPPLLLLTTEHLLLPAVCRLSAAKYLHNLTPENLLLPAVAAFSLPNTCQSRNLNIRKLKPGKPFCFHTAASLAFVAHTTTVLLNFFSFLADDLPTPAPVSAPTPAPVTRPVAAAAFA